MAALNAEDAQHVVSCGNCLETEGYIHNPLLLPCTHTICETCLEGLLKKSDVIKCRVCNEKFTVTAASLPSALKGVLPTFCEPCEKSGKVMMTSLTYCRTCDRRFCGSHQELHIELNVHHETLTVKEYLSYVSNSDEERFCDIHKDQVVGMGCSECWKTYCFCCVSSIGNCEDGANHKLMALKELSAEVKNLFEPKKKEAEKLFDEWSVVMKEAEVTLSRWDIETEKGTRIIDEAEQQQMKAIREKYEKLREDYVGTRNKGKAVLVDFIDKDAGVKLNEFSEHLKVFRSDLSTKHCVDLLKQKTTLENQIDEMTTEIFHPLLLENQQEVHVDDSVSIEISAVLRTVDNIVIGGEVMKSRRPPTSMRLVKKLASNSFCWASCWYKGVTYVALNNGSVNRIDGAGSRTSDFIKLPNAILSIRAHQDQLCILMRGQPYQLYVYDLNGRQITSWIHADMNSSGEGNRLCISRSQIFVADVSNQRITVYDLVGNVLKHIPCSLIPTSGYTSMCLDGRDYALITTCLPPKVSKVNLHTQAVLWTTALESGPFCVASCKGAVLVGGNGSDGDRRVWIEVLDATNGKKVRVFRDQEGTSTNVLDLWTEGDRLLVTSCHQSAVLCYQLMYE